MSLKDKALALLARREHSIFELRQKLLRRGYTLEEIKPTLEDLANLGLQSDERFCRAYIRTRAERGFGPIRLTLELTERGVNKELITICLAEEAVDWEILLQKLYRKKHKLKPETLEEKSRCQRFLLYRGYSLDQINRLFKD